MANNQSTQHPTGSAPPIPGSDPEVVTHVDHEGPPALHSSRFDPDAGSGAKTRKDGKTESFYGYHEHTIVQVPANNSPSDEEPRLITRFELTPASTDVVDVSLSLLDRLARPASVLIVDRHYHYKKVERWRDELAERDIDQVLDLRVDEHGFSELNNLRWAAGWPHCPATPDTYGTIERPAPNETDPVKMRTFRTRINERANYALRRVTTPDNRGVARWECPAMAGQVGCPLREGSVEAAVALGQPIVENPPDPDSADFPKCCRQRTVTVDPGPLRKLMQADYWGSEDWEKVWAKRTYVEGSYGNRKNASTENMTRGYIRTRGVMLFNIMTGMAAVSYNMRMLRNWHARTGRGDPDHPLLAADEEAYGYVLLDKDQYEAMCAAHLRGDPAHNTATMPSAAPAQPAAQDQDEG